MNEQEKFWHSEYSDEYIKRNNSFDLELGIGAWKKVLDKIEIGEIKSVLEVGPNIGRNIRVIDK